MQCNVNHSRHAKISPAIVLHPFQERFRSSAPVNIMSSHSNGEEDASSSNKKYVCPKLGEVQHLIVNNRSRFVFFDGGFNYLHYELIGKWSAIDKRAVRYILFWSPSC